MNKLFLEYWEVLEGLLLEKDIQAVPIKGLAACILLNAQHGLYNKSDLGTGKEKKDLTDDFNHNNSQIVEDNNTLSQDFKSKNYKLTELSFIVPENKLSTIAIFLEKQGVFKIKNKHNNRIIGRLILDKFADFIEKEQGKSRLSGGKIVEKYDAISLNIGIYSQLLDHKKRRMNFAPRMSYEHFFPLEPVMAFLGLLLDWVKDSMADEKAANLLIDLLPQVDLYSLMAAGPRLGCYGWYYFAFNRLYCLFGDKKALEMLYLLGPHINFVPKLGYHLHKGDGDYLPKRLLPIFLTDRLGEAIKLVFL